MSKLRFAGSLLLALMGVSAVVRPALAQPATTQSAAEAERLDAEARALDALDPVRAAHLHDRADRADPRPDRLAAAIDAATRGHEPTLAMTLVERAAGRPSSPGLQAAIAAATDHFAMNVAYVTVACGGCVVTIDGKAGLAQRRNVVPAGLHVIVAGEGAQVQRWSLTLDSGEERELTPPWLAPATSPTPTLPPQVALAPMGGEVAYASPPSRPRSAAAATRALDPAWFWGAVGLTSAVTWATVVSAIDGARENGRDADRPDFFSAVDARRADFRTAILGATAVGCALGTTALGVFAVDFGGSAPATAKVRGTAVEVEGRF